MLPQGNTFFIVHRFIPLEYAAHSGIRNHTGLVIFSNVLFHPRKLHILLLNLRNAVCRYSICLALSITTIETSGCRVAMAARKLRKSPRQFEEQFFSRGELYSRPASAPRRDGPRRHGRLEIDVLISSKKDRSGAQTPRTPSPRPAMTSSVRKGREGTARQCIIRAVKAYSPGSPAAITHSERAAPPPTLARRPLPPIFCAQSSPEVSEDGRKCINLTSMGQ